METENTSLDIEYGLNVLFDGSKYQLMTPHSLAEYPVGGMLCEYLRLHPSELKPVILKCTQLNEKPTADNLFSTLMEFQDLLLESYPPVIVTVLCVEFHNTLLDWFEAVNSDRIDEFVFLAEEAASPQVRDYVFEDSGYTCAGGDTVFQLMLTAYLFASHSFIVLKHLFNEVSDHFNEADSQAKETLASLYGPFMNMQHIDFRVVGIEGDLKSMYSIKTAISLFIFEMANCMKNEVTISKCKNCGNYFIPSGRSDSLYCTYPIEGISGKTCKEVGAQNARAIKERNDIATKEYRKLYMRLKMAASRHPEDEEKQKKLYLLSTQNKVMRKKLESGEISTDDYLNWVEQFK